MCAILTIINVHVDHSDQPDGGKKAKKPKKQKQAPRVPIEVNLSPWTMMDSPFRLPVGATPYLLATLVLKGMLCYAASHAPCPMPHAPCLPYTQLQSGTSISMKIIAEIL